MRRSDTNACVVDTHVWLWAIAGDENRIGRRARRVLSQCAIAYVPAIAQWEIASLVANGRLQLAAPLDEWLEIAAGAGAFRIEPLTSAVAGMTAEIAAEGFHADPADRLIYATARVMGLPLLTGDSDIRAFEARSPQRRSRHVVWN